MTEIIYPTLDLFLYQLRNGLGDSDEQIQKNHQSFWINLPDDIKVNLEKEVEAENPEYTKLLELFDVYIKKDLKIKDNNYHYIDKNHNLEGYYYPVRLYDSYGLIFDTSINDRKNEQSITSFKILAKQAETKKGNLGKSWIASGCLPISTRPKTEQLAKDIYKELVKREWQNPEQGRFLGAALFEVWKSLQKWQDIELENSHILIIIYPNLWTMEVAADFYGDWLRLLCSRNKILWEYAYSQKLTKELQDEFKSIINRTKEVKNLYHNSKDKTFNQQQLNELQKILIYSITTLSDYATKLAYLEILKSAIETNLQAYKKYLQDIERKAQEKQIEDNQIGDTDLRCLEKFTSTVQQKYKIQVEQDHASLNVGLKIAEDLINTVRGIIEIEQTKRDRNLQIYIGAVGAGIGVSGVVASSFQYLIPTDPQVTKIPLQAPFTSWELHPFFIVLLWSLLSGSFVFIVPMLVKRLTKNK